MLEGIDRALDEICDFSREMGITIIVGATLNVGRGLQPCNMVINAGEVLATVPQDDNLVFSTGGVNCSFAPGMGADLLIAPYCEPETIGSSCERIAHYKALSASEHCACICCGAGFGESTSDAVYAGDAFICEDGAVLARSGSLCLHPQLVISDVDCQLLRHRGFDNYGADGDIPVSFETALFPDTDFNKKLYRTTDSSPFIPKEDDADGKMKRALDLQAYALASRLSAINCHKVIAGVSGGLDSTLALLCATRAFDSLGWNRKDIIGITMPGFGTSRRTHGNADLLMDILGITHKEIDITESCRRHLADIGHDGKTQDVTYENAQARERTRILMDVANMEGGLVVGTGDLSELALGWCTYNGDHMSNYAVNSSLPKTLVKALVEWIAHNEADKKLAKVLLDIADTPVSPELKSDGTSSISQKTEDVVGPYELHDFFIYNTIRNGFPPYKTIFLATRAFKGRYTKAQIVKWFKLFVKRFFSQQFKRSCSPDGAAITEVSLSPREGFIMPSDASPGIWNDSIDQI